MENDFKKYGQKLYRTPDGFVTLVNPHVGKESGDRLIRITDAHNIKNLPIEDISNEQAGSIFGGGSSANSTSDRISFYTNRVKMQGESDAAMQNSVKQASDMNAFIAANPNAPSLPTNLDPTGRYSVVNGVLTDKSSLSEEAKNKAAVAAGTMKEISPGMYVPSDSAAEKNSGNIGTHNTANAANAPVPVVELKQGASGDEVKKLQAMIGATPDGMFGPQTRSKLMSFQQKNGLPVTGIADAATMAAISKGETTTTSPKTLKQGEMHPDGSGPVRYDSLTGSPLSAGQTTPLNPADAIAEINNKANEEMKKDLALFEDKLGTKVDESDASKIVKTLVKSFEEKNEESKTFEKSFTEKFADKRAELKVDAKEAEMAGIDTEIAKLDAEWKTLSDTEDNRQVSKLQINRRKSEQQILYEKARGELTARKNGLVDELNQKYNVINTFMKYSEMDYEKAEQEYTNKFNQAISLTNLIKNIEEDEKSDAEKKADKARANLQIMIDSFKGQDFSKVDGATKLELRKMEFAAGLPAGFTDFAVQSVNEPIVSMGSEFTSAGGQRQVPVYTKDPVSGLITSKLITIGTAAVNPTEGDRDRNAINSTLTKLATGPDGYTDPYLFIKERATSDLSPSEFNSRFGHLVNPVSRDIAGLKGSGGSIDFDNL